LAAEVLEVRQLLSASAAVQQAATAATNQINTASTNAQNSVNNYYNQNIKPLVSQANATGNPALKAMATGAAQTLATDIQNIKNAASAGITGVSTFVTENANGTLTSSQAVSDIKALGNSTATTLSNMATTDVNGLKSLKSQLQAAISKPPATVSPGGGTMMNGTMTTPQPDGNGANDAGVDGTVTLPVVKAQDGTKFTAKLSFLNINATDDVGGTIEQVSGSLKAKITNIQETDPGQADDTFVETLSPRGGKITIVYTLNGTTYDIKAKPDGNFTLTLDAKGDVLGFSGSYKLPVIAGVVNGGDATFNLDVN
jgi:hypothetical protein